MEETFHQKVIRNVQGKFLVYKTSEVVGDKAYIPNVEWANTEDVDGFFNFAQQIGTKVVYFTEGEVVDEEANTAQTSILQVGFLFNGVMHHINVADEDESDEEYDEEYESDEEEIDDAEYEIDDDVEDTESEEESVEPQPQFQ